LKAGSEWGLHHALMTLIEGGEAEERQDLTGGRGLM
jgi:hypothetical protein